jgi:hypothetical protein
MNTCSIRDVIHGIKVRFIIAQENGIKMFWELFRACINNKLFSAVKFRKKKNDEFLLVCPIKTNKIIIVDTVFSMVTCCLMIRLVLHDLQNNKHCVGEY